MVSNMFLWRLLLLLLLVILTKSQTSGEGILQLIEASSISSLVVGLIVLVFGIGAAIGGFLIFKLLLRRLKRKDGIPDQITEQESNVAPGLHTYELVDSQARPNRAAAETPMPYEVAVTERCTGAPPVPPAPEEMGFSVTQDIEDNQDGYEDFEPGPVRDENALVTPNPFYVKADDKTKTPNYENYELDEYEDLSNKRDLSAAANPGFSTHDAQQDFQLKSAINFCDRQDIEGDLIDEIDYQNVTVVRTKVENSRQDDTSNRDLLQQGMATASVQWQGNGMGNIGYDRSSNSGNQQPLPDLHDAADIAEDVYDDVSQIAPDLYQNFGAEHCSVARVQSTASMEDEEDIYEDTRLDSETEATDIYDGVDDIYMNAESVNEAVDIDYQNMVPGQFRK